MKNRKDGAQQNTKNLMFDKLQKLTNIQHVDHIVFGQVTRGSLSVHQRTGNQESHHIVGKGSNSNPLTVCFKSDHTSL